MVDLRKTLTGLLGLALFIVAWFWTAGRVNWWQGWIFILIFVIYLFVLVWRLKRVDPDLAAERTQPAETAEPWDRVVMGAYTVTLLILIFLVALDSGRFHWSEVPILVQALGWGLLVLSGAVVWHVMMVNAYLSSYARLQEDRGQVVVQEGLYRFVRHPMYLGIILGMVGLPLALGSWWALIPVVVIVGLFIYRTYREDHMLLAGLEGYVEYSHQVKYRLLPGVW